MFQNESTEQCFNWTHYLNSATAAVLHEITYVSRLNACSNKWFYVVVV